MSALVTARVLVADLKVIQHWSNHSCFSLPGKLVKFNIIRGCGIPRGTNEPGCPLPPMATRLQTAGVCKGTDGLKKFRCSTETDVEQGHPGTPIEV
ncbi:unnamed protein product [Notodromas monacha]|uniref:Uncharacterized protein n=1 Tax=Notodromas monacha TaxID=399045 RepID=A0A7R9BFZ7_9CRUS|nr:unnamed protein product [Notodromas monacha]CAG0913154.1 unnamed protein product [Notodromas monacha]